MGKSRVKKAITHFGDQEYALVQFVEDNAVAVVKSQCIRYKDDNIPTALWESDNKYYVCTIQSKSYDKDNLMRKAETIREISKPMKKKPTKAGGKTDKSDADVAKRPKKTKTGKAQDKNQGSAKKQQNEEYRILKEKEKREKQALREAQLKKDNEFMAMISEEIENNEAVTSEKLPMYNSAESDTEEQSDQSNNPSECSTGGNHDTEEGLTKTHKKKKLVQTCGESNNPSEFSTGRNHASEGLTKTHKKKKLVQTFGKNPSEFSIIGNHATEEGLTQVLEKKKSVQTHAGMKTHTPKVPMSGINKKSTPSGSTIVGPTPGFDSERPSNGMKRPRSLFRQLAEDSEAETAAKKKCQECYFLKKKIRMMEAQQEENEAEIWRLKDELLTSRVNIPPEDEESSPPRPGILKKHIAERFQMLEVMPGSRVFIYEQQMNDARNKVKESGTKAALFLLQCFYKTKDLVGKNLTGANCRESIDPDIVSAIIGFASTASNKGQVAIIKQALRNKMSSVTSIVRKKNGMQVNNRKGNPVIRNTNTDESRSDSGDGSIDDNSFPDHSGVQMDTDSD